MCNQAGELTPPKKNSLSIRPSYGARGEEILDGGGGRGRRERKAWHKTIQQIVWHIQNLDVAVIG